MNTFFLLRSVLCFDLHCLCNDSFSVKTELLILILVRDDQVLRTWYSYYVHSLVGPFAKTNQTNPIQTSNPIHCFVSIKVRTPHLWFLILLIILISIIINDIWCFLLFLSFKLFFKVLDPFFKLISFDYLTFFISCCELDS